jgi:deazaflavin-dependent oxidoreductase (nitroreductase family)
MAESTGHDRNTPSAELEAYNAGVIEEFRANGGRVGGALADRPLLLLHTVAARTGGPRLTPLTYQRRPTGYAVFATKGGSDRNPAWYHNLLATESPSIEVGTETLHVRAREATGEERDRIWERQKELFPHFAEYEQLTVRRIPVIVLEPAR